MDTRYFSMSARVIGCVGALIALGFAVAGALDDRVGMAPWGIALCVLLAVLCWIAMVRPVMVVEDDQVVLRQALETVVVPMSGVAGFTVRAVGRFRLRDGRTLTTAAVSRSRTQLRRDVGGQSLVGAGMGAGSGLFRMLGGGRLDKGFAPPGSAMSEPRHSYGWHIEETMAARIERARVVPAAVERRTEQQVEVVVVRRRAWVEIVVFVLAVLATVVLVFL